ncbi:hypothetical protein [Conexibacter woesei]|uniref:Uncharacterized protein n=1 Tax=Conexibacter woesei (strain DSM 14684 / CCUG 47730 / CIP 108061 / JCM 11494 / NBRC 100937 / ID131577) TaxID=469383 RepID=D3FD72_CONWI|nr:hypothetical protein [Conexibacter woesei]ADB53464.1 hypothetical protein Cwoe_5053 [Conexibacter woesei DSM 14684]
MTTLLPTAAPGLYAPDSGEAFVFLLADRSDPPASIPLGDTWSDEGAARSIGHHVFLDALPSGENALVLAAALAGKLPPAPATTGFAWAVSPPKPFALTAAVELTLSTGGPVRRPGVAADAVIANRRPMPSLTLPAGMAAVAARGSDGAFAGWTLTDLAAAAADPAAARGLGVPLLGRDAGAVAFVSLLESPVRGDRSVKALAAVRIDPLRPLDPRRTSITPLGPEYVLSTDATGRHHLAPAPPTGARA